MNKLNYSGLIVGAGEFKKDLRKYSKNKITYKSCQLICDAFIELVSTYYHAKYDKE